MNKYIKTTLIIVSWLSVSGLNAGHEFNVDIDVGTSSKYKNCQPIAEEIVSLTHRYIASETDSDKAQLAARVTKEKKKLKKCEKRNKKPARTHLNGGKVGFQWQF